jgi:hypothetical protein
MACVVRGRETTRAGAENGDVDDGILAQRERV